MRHPTLCADVWLNSESTRSTSTLSGECIASRARSGRREVVEVEPYAAPFDAGKNQPLSQRQAASLGGSPATPTATDVALPR